MRFSDLKSKEVVSVEDGKKLGFVDDIIFDDSIENVVALRIPMPAKMFKKPEYITIDINAIDKIGENVILVKNCSTGEMNKKTESQFYYSPKVFKRVSQKLNKWLIFVWIM